MAAKDYILQNTKLMDAWAKEAKEWVDCHSTFYADGIFDADVWFSENNDFRPLFILKEVHEAATEESPILNFVGTGADASDPWFGNSMWGRLGALVTAMAMMKKEPDDIPEYYFVKSAMENVQPDGETLRQSILRSSAIINLKKLAAGENANSEKSLKTLRFTCHAHHFSDKLKQQIELIAPKFIVCCSKDVANCFPIEDGNLYGIPVVVGCHPQRTSTEDFYYKPLSEIKARKLL